MLKSHAMALNGRFGCRCSYFSKNYGSLCGWEQSSSNRPGESEIANYRPNFGFDIQLLTKVFGRMDYGNCNEKLFN